MASRQTLCTAVVALVLMALFITPGKTRIGCPAVYQPRRIITRHSDERHHLASFVAHQRCFHYTLTRFDCLAEHSNCTAAAPVHMWQADKHE
jgi:hypothetical protein